MKKNFADIQNYERKKRRAEAGYFYHRQYNQIIVSREELYFQLEKADLNENLVACLAFGHDHPQYDYWLLMASIKFWFIGSLSYPRRRKHQGQEYHKGKKLKHGARRSKIMPFNRADNFEYFAAKPSRDYYKKVIFDSFLENTDEANTWLEHLSGLYQKMPNIKADQLLCKYTVVRNGCIRMLASTHEFYFAEEYKSIIDHIASNNVSMLEFRSKYGDMPILPDKYENILKNGYYGDLYR